ncbi:ABC transporter permease [Pseudofrankia inefficax]|uniref:Binding-protein-dependent transport systems inner membrane component n=1 Tax=Pseudofrankia inefficax (strain DSM 45817 / CECT 9037 / DDB 130130 / EuI1c) TaxID=298654 RepID=E3J3J0_PSEI1|nr:ABC transporter permease subunit [Pseudofrankia inefficax]ADP78192.1 binding-protein-dependent transport systems inner membrane component [Pseudofrankia inefficax]
MSAATTLASSNLPSLGLVPGWLTTASHWWGPHGLLVSLREHVLYTVVAVVVAMIIAVPIGLLVGHTGRGGFAIAGLANAIRAVPAFGLLILLYVVVSPKIHYHGSISWLVPRGAFGSLIPVEAMLVVLAIPPILTNTYAGVQGVDPDVRDAARGMGMRGWQVVTRVELPIALPLVLAGVRSAVLQVIATATIAGYLPFLGGLGYQIFINGLPQINDPDVGYPAMIGAALLVAVLAVVADLLLLGLQRLVVSRGIAGRYRTTLPAPVPPASAAPPASAEI